ncbi:lysylphosphatidylglycerol synthase transmembrane domain-containing protein [Actinomadura sp. DC4]|uniref:lysylphosphatidylglycerol synthase transmembrane domain-containing protein n=1 Tax=Actinomadura sp. DC4 TaxID=3055069 RepID=UPI0025AFEC1A|nr:lysylphosphatidylglycerol synthase transmembrane domain-containing protein [Actinomadura sp. DC4]MDN3359433.1 lysylphosphatidylglycerol synthase transmembrane domain-containing protein [Actinomadura sp. DC4]
MRESLGGCAMDRQDEAYLRAAVDGPFVPPAEAGRAAIVSSSAAKVLLGVAVAGAVVALGITHRAAVDAGGSSLAGADGEWLAVAALATVAMWIAGTVSLLGTLPVRPPLGRVFAVQMAASFANHLMPAGSGAMAVNVRFLQRHGISRGAAVGAVGLNSLATGLTHLALLAGAVVVAPGTLHRLGARVPRPAEALPHPGPGSALVIGALGALAVLALTLRGPRRWLGRRAVRPATALTRMAREMGELRAVLRHPGRAAALWLGSVALPFFHALILFSILRGLGVPMTIGTVVVVYLGVSSLAAVVPSPGGIGGLDVALVTGLVAAGASSTVAVGTVLGYRMITVWLPLLPAAGMFAVLLRRRII